MLRIRKEQEKFENKAVEWKEKPLDRKKFLEDNVYFSEQAPHALSELDELNPRITAATEALRAKKNSKKPEEVFDPNLQVRILKAHPSLDEPKKPKHVWAENGATTESAPKHTYLRRSRPSSAPSRRKTSTDKSTSETRPDRISGDYLYPATAKAGGLDHPSQYLPRGCFRQQAAKYGANMPDDDRESTAPDVVKGLWTCCRNVKKFSNGCKKVEEHSCDNAQCSQCGLWLNSRDFLTTTCTYHAGEVQESHLGGVTWSCCSHTGYNNTLWDYPRKAQARKLECLGYNSSVRGMAGWAIARENAELDPNHRIGCRTGSHQHFPGREFPKKPPRPLAIILPGAYTCGQCGVDMSDDGPCAYHPGMWCESRSLRLIHSVKPVKQEEQQAVEYRCTYCLDIIMSTDRVEHEKTCTGFPVPCEHCGAAFSRSRMAAHLEICPQVVIRCTYQCGTSCRRDEMGAHLRVCTFLPTACEYGCETILPVHMHKDHKVRCILRPLQCPRGCLARLTSRTIKDHEDKCPLLIISCELCLAKIRRKDVQLHRKSCPELEIPCNWGCLLHVRRHKMNKHATVCPRAPATCHNEGCVVRLTNEELEAHLLCCPKRSVVCKWGCGLGMLLEDLDSHKNVCPNYVIDCRMACGYLCQRELMSSHIPVCPLELVTCECGSVITREEITTKHWEVCDFGEVPCPNIWCFAVVRRGDLNSHVRQCKKPEIVHTTYVTPLANRPQWDPNSKVKPQQPALMATLDIPLPDSKEAARRPSQAPTPKVEPAQPKPRRPGNDVFPVCDGYCMRRAKMAGGPVVPHRHKSPPKKREPAAHKKTKKEAAAAKVNRRSWMMMEPISIHWSKPDRQRWKSLCRTATFFPKAPTKKAKHGMCQSQEPPRRPRSVSPSRARSPPHSRPASRTSANLSHPRPASASRARKSPPRPRSPPSSFSKPRRKVAASRQKSPTKMVTAADTSSPELDRLEPINLIDPSLRYNCTVNLRSSTAKELAFATVTVFKHEDVDRVRAVESGHTGLDGVVRISLPVGRFSLVCDAAQHSQAHHEVEISDEDQTVHILLCPLAAVGTIRVLLRWDTLPKFVDLCLWTKLGTVNRRNQRVGGCVLEKSSFSETHGNCVSAVVNLKSDNVVHIYAHNTSGEASLPASNACLQVHGPVGQLASLSVPLNSGTTKYWSVCLLKSSPLEIVPLQQMLSLQELSSVLGDDPTANRSS